MPAAERSVIAESLLRPIPLPQPVRSSRGALIAAPAPPARGSKAKKAKHPNYQYLAKFRLTAPTQRRSKPATKKLFGQHSAAVRRHTLQVSA